MSDTHPALKLWFHVFIINLIYHLQEFRFCFSLFHNRPNLVSSDKSPLTRRNPRLPLLLVSELDLWLCRFLGPLVRPCRISEGKIETTTFWTNRHLRSCQSEIEPPGSCQTLTAGSITLNILPVSLSSLLLSDTKKMENR